MDYRGVLMFGAKVFYKDRGGEWRWKAVAKNHWITGGSGEGYKNFLDMKRGAFLTAMILLFGKTRVVRRSQ